MGSWKITAIIFIVLFWLACSSTFYFMNEYIEEHEKLKDSLCSGFCASWDYNVYWEEDDGCHCEDPSDINDPNEMMVSNVDWKMYAVETDSDGVRTYYLIPEKD